jgi:hypothetical protein
MQRAHHDGVAPPAALERIGAVARRLSTEFGAMELGATSPRAGVATRTSCTRRCQLTIAHADRRGVIDCTVRSSPEVP